MPEEGAACPLEEEDDEGSMARTGVELRHRRLQRLARRLNEEKQGYTIISHLSARIAH